MRAFFAIVLCKLGHFIGKLMHRGSSMPGKYALKLCPDILEQIIFPPVIIAVTGSNGKTSTVEMIAAILKANGKRVVFNGEGSNQIEGVTTTVLTSSTFSGIMKADVLLIESDERYAAHTFKYFHPTHFVVSNLYRDQLTRNGHPEWVFDCLRPVMFPETRLILNADDPLTSAFGSNRGNVAWFGIDECAISSKDPSGMYRDGAYCPLCKSPMLYRYYHFNHIGSYRCPTCDFQKADPTDYTATDVDLEDGTLTLDGGLTIQLAFHSVYNVYNILAAYAVCRECGIPAEEIGDVVNNYVLKNGRMVRFMLGARHGMLLTSKHENSIAYDTNLRYIRSTRDACVVVLLVDAISRKYYTSETSWLWDIDFNQLNCEHISKVILSGQYANDLALRMTFTQIPRNKLQLCPDITEACNLLKAEGVDDVYVLTCFSDRDKLLSQVEILKEAT